MIKKLTEEKTTRIIEDIPLIQRKSRKDRKRKIKQVGKIENKL